MNIENEYKEFNDYWNETIKGNSWTTLERQACFMGWIEAKKRALNLYNVVGRSEQSLAVAEYVYNHFDDSSSKTAKDYLQDFLSQ